MMARRILCALGAAVDECAGHEMSDEEAIARSLLDGVEVVLFPLPGDGAVSGRVVHVMPGGRFLFMSNDRRWTYWGHLDNDSVRPAPLRKRTP
jgi:hypothetical protein